MLVVDIADMGGSIVTIIKNFLPAYTRLIPLDTDFGIRGWYSNDLLEVNWIGFEISNNYEKLMLLQDSSNTCRSSVTFIPMIG